MCKQEFSKGLLILRNSPLNCGLSPAELSMGRQLDDDLPKFHKPRPKIAKRNLLQEREKSKQLHDKDISTKSTTKEVFAPGMRVAIQDQ